MKRDTVASILDRLHAAQNAMYSGGDVGAMCALLTPDIEWQVPGENAIAGTYSGIEQVLEYFVRRRALAGDTLRLHPVSCWSASAA